MFMYIFIFTVIFLPFDIQLNQQSLHKSLDKPAFELLFENYFVVLSRFAYGYIKDQDASQEIVQDVFINLWNKRDAIDPEKQVKSYLYTSVKNRCLNYIRDHKKFRSFYLDVELELEIPDTDPDLFSENETKIKIQNALAKLPERCRQVFEMSRFEEMKYKDIAAQLGISIKTVEVQVSKALKILRDELKEFLMILILLILK